MTEIVPKFVQLSLDEELTRTLLTRNRPGFETPLILKPREGIIRLVDARDLQISYPGCERFLPPGFRKK